MSYCGLLAPITPATTGPIFKPQIENTKPLNMPQLTKKFISYENFNQLSLFNVIQLKNK